MNTSELSVTAADAVAESQRHGSQSPWGSLARSPLSDSLAFSNGRNCDSTVEIESSDATAVHDLQGSKAAQARSVWQAKQLDLGLWLLRGSTFRHSRWKCLRETAQSAVEVRDSDSEYSPHLKRSFDVLGSLFLLIILFPLFVLIAILIKLDSSGPIFFRHNRVGRSGRNFVLWKFRSMRTNVPKYAASPRSSEDIRLTRVGRLIRRLSIDEMPQLINVLRGEMSLVGPRPEMPFIVDLYRPAECVRFVAKPGITGLWQISPARAFPIHDNLQYDLYYIHNQSFVLDCAIIVRTIAAVIHGIGAV